MYEIIDLRTGETIAEFFTYQTALIRCNALTFVFGRHYAIRPGFEEEIHYGS